MIKLAPSSLERVALCPASYWAEKGLPFTDNSGGMVDEGKLLHAVIAGTAKSDNLTRAQKADVNFCMAAAKELLQQIFGEAKLSEHCHEKYFQVKLADDVILSGLIDWYGYRSGSGALIIDWKFGRNATEEAEGNLQLRAYVVMLAEEINQLKSVDICVSVIQPRVDADNRVTLARYVPQDVADSRQEILDIAEAVRLAESNPQRTPGDKQCRYCKALGTERCQESMDTAKALAPIALTDVMPSGRELAKLLDLASVAEDAIGKVKDYAKNRLKAGDTIPGWELKANAPMRIIRDAEQAWYRVQDILEPAEYMGACKVSVTSLQNAVAEKKRWGTKEAKVKFSDLMGEAISMETKEPSLARAKTKVEVFSGQSN